MLALQGLTQSLVVESDWVGVEAGSFSQGGQSRLSQEVTFELSSAVMIDHGHRSRHGRSILGCGCRGEGAE